MTDRLASIRTPWTDIVLAQQGDPAVRAKCLEELAKKYYEPIRAYIGVWSQARQASDVDDMTQDFFHRFLEKNMLDMLDRSQGTLRGFLLVTVRRFVLDEMRRGSRSNPNSPLTRHNSLQYSETVVDDTAPSPEDALNYQWAEDLMADIFAAFKAECQDHGKKHYYLVAEQQLLRPENFSFPTYADTAASLGISEKDVSNYLHRSRNILKDLTRRMVRHTVDSDDRVEKEMADLQRYYRPQHHG